MECLLVLIQINNKTLLKGKSNVYEMYNINESTHNDYNIKIKAKQKSYTALTTHSKLMTQVQNNGPEQRQEEPQTNSIRGTFSRPIPFSLRWQVHQYLDIVDRKVSGLTTDRSLEPVLINARN